VIDDDPTTCELLSEHLHSLNYEVHVAHSSEQGLSLAKQLQPYAITLDIQMPDMDGFELIGHLRTNPKWWLIPVIILTGKEVNKSELTMLNQCVENVFMKETYHQAELLAEIEWILKHHESSDR